MRPPGHSWTSAIWPGLLRRGQCLLPEAQRSSPLSRSLTGTLLRVGGSPCLVTVRVLLQQEAQILSSETPAARNPAAHSAPRNAAHSTPKSGPVKSATPPVSTTGRSHHRESVRCEMHEHAEQAEARAKAAYEQNRAALELISKAMDNVRDAFTKARRAHDRFHDLLCNKELSPDSGMPFRLPVLIKEKTTTLRNQAEVPAIIQR